MAYEYVNIKTDTIDNVKVPTKETLDARTIIESTLEPSDGNGTTICVYHIGLWQFPKTGLYKIHLTQHGTTSDLFKVFARKTKDDGTLPEDFTQDNLVIQHLAMGDTQVNDLYIQVDYIDNDKLTVYNVKFLTLLQPYNAQVNVYDKTTQKWQFVSATYVQSAKSADRLAHQLTLTKGDTTTKFDGSTAQTVSIPTKTSELTNDSFVSYAEQALTEDQQNQAKTNLGIDILTGNTTAITPTQVKEAILAGRPVSITYTDTTYGNLTFTSFGYSLENNVVAANLVATSYGKYILASLTGNSNNNNWTLQTTELGTSTDIANNYVKYSESQTLTGEQKATARTNIGATFEPFKVTLNRTYGKPYLDKTPKEINDAYTAGKYVYLQGPLLLPLTHAIRNGDEKYTISFSGTSKVSEDSSIQVASFSVINVTPYYSGQWTENYKYNIDAKVLKLNYNPSTHEVSGNNPYNSISMLNYNGSGQTAIVQLDMIEANTIIYLNQISTANNNAFAFQAFIGDELLMLLITSDSMQIQSLHIINENNIRNIVDQSYVAFYTEQSLSDEEKKQARNNIGIRDPFKVTFTRSYGKVSADKTAKEIKDAANNGQFVYGIFANNNTATYQLSSASDSDTIEFIEMSYEPDKVDGTYIGLQYSVLYKNNPSNDFTGAYDEDFSSNFDAPSFEIATIVLNNDAYKFQDNKYNYITISRKLLVFDHYVNSNIYLSYENNLYRLSKNFRKGTDALVFERVSYDTTTSSIKFETFTINTDSTITYDSQTFEQSSTQSDWNQNNTTASDYIKNRPGGYYSVVNSVDSGTLTTTDFANLSSEGPGITGYVISNETFNTALQNLNVTAGKTYKISWVDNGQAFSYISEAVDLVKTEGSVTYHNICIFGDTIVNLTTAELIWGKTAKVIFLSNSVAEATNTVTNVKVEEVNVVKIPKALVESDSIEEFDLSNNYTATNKGSIKYIKTDRQDSTVHYALLGFENEDNLYPKLKVSGQEPDTSYVNTTEYSSGSIESSWVNHSETGDTFIQGMAICHDPNNKLLKLKSKLFDNITEDLTVRGIATPTADNDAVNKKYVDDQVYYIKQDILDNYLCTTSEQTLTDSQKQRALSNLGISIPEISVVTLDD